MRQELEQASVHRAARHDVRVHDGVVLHGEVVVIAVIAVKNQDDGAADVVDRQHRQIEEVAGDDDAGACRHHPREAAQDGVQVLDWQCVLERRLAVARQPLREARVGVQMVVREHDVGGEAAGLPVLQQVRDEVHRATELVRQHVHDARLPGHRATAARGVERRALTTSG